MNVAVIFIAYNPILEELNKNILKVINDVEVVLIWQNSIFTKNFITAYKEKIIWLGSGQNEFIAKPLNVALDYCLKNNITHLLTMDQDSEWEDLNGFLNEVNEFYNEDTIINAPNINGSDKSLDNIVEIETAITSGALHNVKLASKLGGFRENYKIYWVDSEFCYWAKYNNYKIKRHVNYKIKHKFGDVKRKLFGIKGYNYSPIVYYFLFRNMLWMRKEYGSHAVSTKTILYTFKLLVPGIILIENRKFFKLFKIFLGLKDGFINKLTYRNNEKCLSNNSSR